MAYIYHKLKINLNHSKVVLFEETGEKIHKTTTEEKCKHKNYTQFFNPKRIFVYKIKRNIFFFLENEIQTTKTKLMLLENWYKLEMKPFLSR